MEQKIDSETRKVEVWETYGYRKDKVVCPFCNHEIIVYAWSYCGSGKKCSCGAVLCRRTAIKKTKRTSN